MESHNTCFVCKLTVRWQEQGLSRLSVEYKSQRNLECCFTYRKRTWLVAVTVESRTLVVADTA